MTKYIDQKIMRRFDDGGERVHGMQFEGCFFDNCGISMSCDINHRSVYRDISIIDGEVGHITFGMPIVEQVHVNGLATCDLLHAQGALFKHVTFKGEIGNIMLSPLLFDATDEQQAAADEQRKAYYGKIEWALDISQASFQSLDIRGIPSKLIKRDPETQVVVTRERLKKNWAAKTDAEDYWYFVTNLLLEDPPVDDEDLVCVLPYGEKMKPAAHLAAFDRMRQLGLIEPD